jgi:retron-type reverse transcriptase
MSNWKPPETNAHIMSPEIFESPEHGSFVGWVYDREGDVIFWSVHEDAMYAMRQRITYLENIIYEQNRMLTGD